MYKWSKILPLSITGTAGAVTGGEETMIEIPSKVFNLAKSYLSFTYTPPATAPNHLIWTACDVFPYIRQIQLYTRGGLFLGDIGNLDNYTKAVWKSDTKLEEFLTSDTASPNATAGIGGESQALRRSNSLVAATTLGARYGGASAASLNYTECAYQMCGDAVTVPVFLNVRLDMSMIKNSIFAIDHDLFFDEILVLRIIWQTPAKYTYDGTTVGDPSAGSAIISTSQSANIGGVALYLAVETNQEVAQQIKAKKNSPEGLSVLIPYVYGVKTALAAGSVAVSMRFNRGHGLRLLKIYHMPCSNVETSAITSYVTSNIGHVNITDFYTLLNNNRLQEFNLVCNNGDDYMILKDRLKGSVYQNRNMYEYNWVWIEEFDGYVSPLNENLRPDDDNFIKGLDLSSEQKWDIYMTQNAANLNHFTFAITQKQLIINSAGIQIM
jgi:hypothetical protein